MTNVDVIILNVGDKKFFEVPNKFSNNYAAKSVVAPLNFMGKFYVITLVTRSKCRRNNKFNYY